ncbi:MAG: Nramp family divalent metal transporter [Nitrospirae bacterium]|nr:Nramp family divalent metal transporter [Nitrospirota bacterium]
MEKVRSLFLGLRRLDRRRLAILLAVAGPGIITANADNDAGGIATYAIAGAQEGYGLLWLLFVITFNLAVIQEMAARMGAVTGKGLADLIREKFGVKLTFVCMLLLVIANLTTTTAEFAGVAAAMSLFGVSKYISIPLAAVFVWVLVVKGNYKRVERVFLIFCLVFFSYVVSGVLASPPWGEVMASMVRPSFKLDSSYINLSIALIGTTITPWMQFFLQSSVVDKGVRADKYGYTRVEVFLGALFTDFIAFFIIVATAATLFHHGIRIESAADAALALRPLAGDYAYILFAVGLLNASLMAASILPLSTSYAVCEAFGWESGMDKGWEDAPQFLGLYTGFIVIGAFIIMLPGVPLFTVMLISQTVSGILLPVILIFMLLIINDREVMGKYVNGPVFNTVAWFTAGAVIVMTALLLATTVFPDLFG